MTRDEWNRLIATSLLLWPNTTRSDASLDALYDQLATKTARHVEEAFNELVREIEFFPSLAQIERKLDELYQRERRRGADLRKQLEPPKRDLEWSARWSRIYRAICELPTDHPVRIANREHFCRRPRLPSGTVVTSLSREEDEALLVRLERLLDEDLPED